MFALLFGFYQIIFAIDSVFCAGEKKFIVKIEADRKNSSCVGTVITKNVLLTAAHCVHDVVPAALSVVQFTPEVCKHEVEAITLHPDFDLPTLYGDIALVKLKTQLRYPWKAMIVNDATLRNSLRLYEDCNMVGWVISANISLLSGEKPYCKVRLDSSPDLPWLEDVSVRLTRVPVSLITGAECSKKIKDLGGNFHGDEKLCGLKVSETWNNWCSIGSGGPLLCAGRNKMWGSRYRTHGKKPAEIALEYEKVKLLGVNDTLEDPLDLLANFEGDAEGRMKRNLDDVDDEYQLAIISWGKMCSNVPSVFVRTDSYYDWIKNSVADFDDAGSIRTYSSAFVTASISYRTIQFRVSLSLLSVIGAICLDI